MPMQQDLNEAVIFAKVVEKGSFTRAARSLGLPKTTVSRKVQDLEQRLGVRLLNRTTRQLNLTEAGAVYFEYSSRIAHELDEAMNAVLQLEDSPRGWLRVTAPFSLCSEVLSGLVRDFRELYPDVRVDLVLSNDRLDLIANQIDVAIRVGPMPDSSLVARTISRYRSFVYASERYIQRYGEPRIPEELEHHHALAAPADRRGDRHAWVLQHGGRSQEFTVNPVAVANDPFALRSLLLGGHGLMLSSEFVMCYDLQRGAVRRVLEGWTGPEMQLSAVYSGGKVVPPKVRSFVDFVTERLRIDHMLCTAEAGEADAAGGASAELDIA
jgi:LysR family transcriptional regulator, regulator for bpeEF and oprC